MNRKKLSPKIAKATYFADPLYDIAKPEYAVEVQTGLVGDSTTLWVNIGPICVLRISGIDSAVKLAGKKENTRPIPY